MKTIPILISITFAAIGLAVFLFKRNIIGGGVLKNPSWTISVTCDSSKRRWDKYAGSVRAVC